MVEKMKKSYRTKSWNQNEIKIRPVKENKDTSPKDSIWNVSKQTIIIHEKETTSKKL